MSSLPCLRSGTTLCGKGGGWHPVRDGRSGCSRRQSQSTGSCHVGAARWFQAPRRPWPATMWSVRRQRDRGQCYGSGRSRRWFDKLNAKKCSDPSAMTGHGWIDLDRGVFYRRRRGPPGDEKTDTAGSVAPRAFSALATLETTRATVRRRMEQGAGRQHRKGLQQCGDGCQPRP
jgi:hypothetical protein